MTNNNHMNISMTGVSQPAPFLKANLQRLSLSLSLNLRSLSLFSLSLSLSEETKKDEPNNKDCA